MKQRLPRALHPAAWWIWALGLAVAVSRTTDPVLLALALAVLGLVVTARRGDSPWARAFRYYLYLAATVVVIRVVFRSVFGGDIAASTMHVWVRLPRLPLPRWAAGVQIGGPVTAEGTLSALYDGMMLGCMLACIGAANALANPKRVLRLLPGALYELGVAVVVAISVAPQLVESVQRVRRARRLRGGGGPRRRVLMEVAVPVVQDALDRSLHLAAAMDSRGYGRTGTIDRRSRHVTSALVLAGLAGLCLGTYGLLSSSRPSALSLAGTAAGAGLCAAGLLLGGRRVRRTRYRPDPWKAPEWAVAALGLVPLVVFTAGPGVPAGSLNPSTYPLAWPAVPVLPVLGLLCAALAAVVAPPPPRRPARQAAPPAAAPAAAEPADRPATSATPEESRAAGRLEVGA